MIIFVDADSCPMKVREVVCRAAARVQVEARFVANRPIPIIENEMTRMIVVAEGEGVADDAIVDEANPGDLVITRDIPLASRLVEAGITTLNDRGNHYTADNIRERLAYRNFMTELRQSGINPEQHSSFSNKELQKFASAFDRELTKLLRVGE